MTVIEKEKWTGRSAVDIAKGGLLDAGSLFVLLRAQGKSREDALEQVAAQYNVHHPQNRRQLAERCDWAEKHERERGSQAATGPDHLKPQADFYRAARARGLSRSDAVSETARAFAIRHRLNVERLRERCAQEDPPRTVREPDAEEVSAIATDATKRLGALEEERIALAARSLVDSEIASELEHVESQIQSCRQTLERVRLVQAAEKAAA